MNCTFSQLSVPGEEIKRDPEIGKTAIQPEPAQTADLSISGSCLISSLCTRSLRWSMCVVIVGKCVKRPLFPHDPSNGGGWFAGYFSQEAVMLRQKSPAMRSQLSHRGTEGGRARAAQRRASSRLIRVTHFSEDAAHSKSKTWNAQARGENLQPYRN